MTPVKTGLLALASQEHTSTPAESSKQSRQLTWKGQGWEFWSLPPPSPTLQAKCLTQLELLQQIQYTSRPFLFLFATQLTEPFFHSLRYYPSVHNCLSWVKLKPTAESFFQVSQGPTSATFPGVFGKELDWKWSSQNLNWYPYGIPELQLKNAELGGVQHCSLLIFNVHNEGFIE